MKRCSWSPRCSLETEKYEGVIFKGNCVTSMGKWFTTELINSVHFQSFYGQGKLTLSSQFNDKLLGTHIDEKKNKKIRKLFFTALVFVHFAWSEFTSIFQSLWVCSTISHWRQLHGNLGDLVIISLCCLYCGYPAKIPEWVILSQYQANRPHPSNL